MTEWDPALIEGAPGTSPAPTAPVGDGPQPEAAFGQEFDPGRFQRALNGQEICFAGQAATRLEIAQHADADPSCVGELQLRPIKQTARRAGCRGTEDHEMNLMRAERIVKILSFRHLIIANNEPSSDYQAQLRA